MLFITHYQYLPDIGGKEQYKVQTFNILVQNTQPFTVESSSLKFLLRHGFDLNRQALLGLPYTPGNDAKVGIYSSKH